MPLVQLFIRWMSEIATYGVCSWPRTERTIGHYRCVVASESCPFIAAIQSGRCVNLCEAFEHRRKVISDCTWINFFFHHCQHTIDHNAVIHNSTWWGRCCGVCLWMEQKQLIDRLKLLQCIRSVRSHAHSGLFLLSLNEWCGTHFALGSQQRVVIPTLPDRMAPPQLNFFNRSQ